MNTRKQDLAILAKAPLGQPMNEEEEAALEREKARERLPQIKKQLRDLLLGDRIPLDVWNWDGKGITEKIIIPAGKKITCKMIDELCKAQFTWETDPSPMRCKLRQIFNGVF